MRLADAELFAVGEAALAELAVELLGEAVRMEESVRGVLEGRQVLRLREARAQLAAAQVGVVDWCEACVIALSFCREKMIIKSGIFQCLKDNIFDSFLNGMIFLL